MRHSPLLFLALLICGAFGCSAPNASQNGPNPVVRPSEGYWNVTMDGAFFSQEARFKIRNMANGYDSGPIDSAVDIVFWFELKFSSSGTAIESISLFPYPGGQVFLKLVSGHFNYLDYDSLSSTVSGDGDFIFADSVHLPVHSKPVHVTFEKCFWRSVPISWKGLLHFDNRISDSGIAVRRSDDGRTAISWSGGARYGPHFHLALPNLSLGSHALDDSLSGYDEETRNPRSAFDSTIEWFRSKRNTDSVFITKSDSITRRFSGTFKIDGVLGSFEDVIWYRD